MNATALIGLVCSSWCALSVYASSPSGLQLPRSSPESEGIASADIRSFVQAADEQIKAMNSFMLVRYGKVIAEGWWSPYGPEIRHTLFSLSKSFTSTAVGLAIAEGKLGLHDEVLKFFPEDAPEIPTNNLKSMRVRDLLIMSTGHQTEPRLNERSNVAWTKIFLSQPVPHKPGTHFLYNTPATYMQSAIVQKVTGQTLLDYLRPRLFEPLGIENPRWGASPQGINFGGYGLDIRTEDIAKFGQLYLQKGRWNGKQLVPESWVEASTSRQTSNGSSPASDWDQGYGFQFWRCRHGAFRGDGAFGQYCLVMPEQDAVVAITSGTRDMQAVLDLIWEKLLPAMKSSPLPENPVEHDSLKKVLGGLTLPLAKGQATSDGSRNLAGKRYVFDSNAQKIESIQFMNNRKNELPTIRLRVNGTEYDLVCGYNRWNTGRMAYGNLAEQPVAASGAWTEDGSYSIKLCFYETPTYVTVKMKPEGKNLSYQAEYNVAFGPTRQPELFGALQ